MAASVFRILVPDAPLYRRTEGDTFRSPEFAARNRAGNLSLAFTPLKSALTQPSLISSYQGKIQSLLFSFPKYSVQDERLVAAYQSLIKALPNDTDFVVVHHKSHRADVEAWFKDAGHVANVTYVPLADYVSFTDWAEDGYVSLSD